MSTTSLFIFLAAFCICVSIFFFFQAEDGIRDYKVTGVQTCALPILYFNDEPLFIIHQPAAHTNGDSIVFFRQSDVVAAGDVYINTSYPVIDMMSGGTINGEIEALNRILDITVAKEKEEGGTYVIPGHGRLADEADIFAYRNMVTIIRDRIQDLKKKGMSLAQIKATRPTLDFDRRYSTPSL